MIYTEEKAYTKRCTPMQVIRIMDSERFDSLVASGEAQLQCIGSACAQWRWYDPEEGYPWGRVHIEEERAWRHGYCGLAGAPL